MVQKKVSSYNRHSIVVISLLVFFILIISVEQWLNYRELQNYIGNYAYSDSFALRTLGRYNQYIGEVVDVKWNAFPNQEEDIEGFQPRLLIARETTSGVTETQWWCAYLFQIKDRPPKNYTPTPFPELNLVEGS